jgi:hypothetical protein
MYSFWTLFSKLGMGVRETSKGTECVDRKEEKKGDAIVGPGGKEEEENKKEDEEVEEDDDRRDGEDEDNAENYDDEDSEDEDEDYSDAPVITVHPGCGFTVDEGFDCPLRSESHFTLSAAYKSATDGCPYCILRWTAIQEVASDFPDSAEFEGTHDYIFLPFRIQRQQFVLAWDGNDDGQKFKKPPYDEDDVFQFCNFYGNMLGGIESVDPVVPCDTSSTKTLVTVQKWLKRCDAEHTCTQNSSIKLPRRVLDVRNNRIKLRETTHVDKGAKYACLSHCWGTPSTEIFRVCTTPATITSYYEDIPFDPLPRTFQDAVSFTRKLGIPFLWIDSLCIIQMEPDKKDWHEQSANMANIYHNAHLTLAAAISTKPTGGCYTRENAPRPHRIGRPIAVVRFSDGTESNLFARRKFGHDAYSLPLLKRGWVYQERILSPRVIYFTGEEVVWECNQTVTCECGGDDIEDKFERIRISDEGEDRVIGPIHQHPKPLRLWYQIVHDYTALSLSYRSDALPALSGIAKVFGAKIQDEYVAGMWRRTLVTNLLWYFMGEQPQQEQGKTGRVTGSEEHTLLAPSWSWVARICTSKAHSKAHFLPVTKELAKVKDLVYQPDAADPTGALETEAHLTLTTKALSASLEPSPNHPDSPYTIRLDRTFTLSNTPSSHSWSVWNLRTGYLDLDHTHLSASSDILLAQIAACTEQQRIHLYEHHEHIPIHQQVRSYMLLARKPRDGEDEHWVRIGLATIAEYDAGAVLYGPDAGEMDSEAKAEIVRGMTREGIQAAVEGDAEERRKVFRKFDEAEMRDLIVW